MFLSGADWGAVIAAVIVAPPAYVAAFNTHKNRQSLKTPSKTSIGKQVEDALQTSIANNFRMQALSSEFDVPMPEKAAEVEARVEALNQIETRAQREARG